MYGVLGVVAAVGVVYLLNSGPTQAPPSARVVDSNDSLAAGDPPSVTVEELNEDDSSTIKTQRPAAAIEETRLDQSPQEEPQVDELALDIDTQVQLALERGVITDEEIPAFVEETKIILEARAADLQAQQEEAI
jgi:hypothetical protein